MDQYFGSDSFFRQLLQLRETDREEMALALMHQTRKVCRSIVLHHPKYGFSDASESDLECFIEAASIDVLRKIDAFLDDDRNNPDIETEPAYSPFQRQRWFSMQVLTAMKAEKRRLYDSFSTVSLDEPLDNDEDSEVRSSTIPGRDPTPEQAMVMADTISDRFGQMFASSCSTDTVLCVVYSILAQETDRSCTYDTCEERLSGKNRREVCRMIVECVRSLALAPSVAEPVASRLHIMMEQRLKKEDPERPVMSVTADRLRKSKSRLFSLISHLEGE